MLVLLGALVGIISGLLGIGGGILLVPALVALNYLPIYAVSTSALAMTIISLSGSLYHWKKGAFHWREVFAMALPCLLFAQLGIILATSLPAVWLLILFGFMLLGTSILINLRRPSKDTQNTVIPKNSLLNLFFVGSTAGFLAGLFGVGGGIVLVPLQVLVLNQDIKMAVRNSLVIVVFASAFSSIGHGLAHHIIFQDGLLIGMGGAVSAILSSHLSLHLKAQTTRHLFTFLLLFLSACVFWQAYSLLDALLGTATS